MRTLLLAPLTLDVPTGPLEPAHPGQSGALHWSLSPSLCCGRLLAEIRDTEAA
jgi:hypothetical protein